MSNLNAYSARKYTSTPDLNAGSQRSSATYIVDRSDLTSQYLGSELSSSSSSSSIESFDEENIFHSMSNDQDQESKLSKNIHNLKHNQNELKLLKNIFDSFHSKRLNKLIMHKKKRHLKKRTVRQHKKSRTNSTEPLQTDKVFSKFEINYDLVTRLFMVFCFIVIIFYVFLVLPISYSFSKKKLVVFSFK